MASRAKRRSEHGGAAKRDAAADTPALPAALRLAVLAALFLMVAYTVMAALRVAQGTRTTRPPPPR